MAHAAAGDQRTKRPARGLRGWLLGEGSRLLVMLVLLAIARTSLANHYGVPSGSMEYTLMPGDHVVVDMSAYGLRIPFTDVTLVPRAAPRRGDIAVFKSPRDGVRLIKRVVAVGGDRVELHEGHLSIDGTPLGEPGNLDVERFGARRARLNLGAGGGPDIDALVVPEGQVLVVGDHRGNSLDGRYFGLVPASQLYARAVGVFWRRGEGPVWEPL